MEDSKINSFYEYYHILFGPFRNKVKSVLEIGVDNKDSKKVWKKYFPKAKNIQICKKLLPEEENLIFDIIVDDISHKNVRESFKILFSKLNQKGFYVIENLGLCNKKQKMFEYLKNLVKEINKKDKKSDIASSISYIFFGRHICFIKKR